MKLNTYFKTNMQISFAAALNVTPGMVSHWVSGRRPVNPAQCVLIEQVTEGSVTRKDLRPDDWHLIWPELIGVSRKRIRYQT